MKCVLVRCMMNALTSNSDHRFLLSILFNSDSYQWVIISGANKLTPTSTRLPTFTAVTIIPSLLALNLMHEMGKRMNILFLVVTVRTTFPWIYLAPVESITLWLNETRL